eukprot:GAFH01002824.1.p2 GENE.GAFH01002824.1~~GAFH01002824.1.p2  ORF type:complete len:331 (-),score=100.87 GAFH01002824.1:19-1011(-)
MSCGGCNNPEQAKSEGKCAGCPMRGQCSGSCGGAAPVDPDLAAIATKMSNVAHKVLVLSGKGGVGKSTVSAQIAWALSLQNRRVGLLDLDICGPSIPRMLGIENESIHASGSGWAPVSVNENLSVMSIGFLLPSKNDAVIWRGPRKNGLIKQFLKDTDWGDLDYLVIDTPPGTSDEHISIVQYLKDAGIDGAVIVTTPQEVSLLAVRKEITFCRKTGVKVLGVIENMSGFICPCCKHETKVFNPSTGGAQRMCEEMSCPFLGPLPLDPSLGMCGESGVSLIEKMPESLAAAPMRTLFDSVVRVVEHPETVPAPAPAPESPASTSPAAPAS